MSCQFLMEWISNNIFFGKKINRSHVYPETYKYCTCPIIMYTFFLQIHSKELNAHDSHMFRCLRYFTTSYHQKYNFLKLFIVFLFYFVLRQYKDV